MNRLIYSFQMEYQGSLFTSNNFNARKPFYGVNYSIENNPDNKVAQSVITLYNLPEEVRTFYAKSEEEQKDISITFSVGNSIDGGATQIFSGKALTVKSAGKITIATEIVAYPIPYLKIYSQITIAKGATVRDLKTVFANKLGLTVDNRVNDDDVVLHNGYNSFTSDILQAVRDKFANQQITIENDKLLFLPKNNNGLKSSIPVYVFTESTGMFEEPVKSGLLTEVKNFLRPNVKRGDNVIINATVNYGNNYNGSYIVCGSKHTGLISCTKSELNYSVFSLRRL